MKTKARWVRTAESSRIESVNVGVVVMNAFRSHKSRGVIMESYLPRASTASLDTVTE